jgi:hypothetical protein
MNQALNSPAPDLIEIILSHDGKYWIARDRDFELRGQTLVEIDRFLFSELKNQRGLTGNIKVCMRFDMTALPRRLHQYSAHYFNRIVSFSLPAD